MNPYDKKRYFGTIGFYFATVMAFMFMLIESWTDGLTTEFSSCGRRVICEDSLRLDVLEIASPFIVMLLSWAILKKFNIRILGFSEMNRVLKGDIGLRYLTLFVFAFAIILISYALVTILGPEGLYPDRV